MTIGWKLAGASSLVLALAACGGGGHVSPTAAPHAGVTGDEVGQANQLLLTGDTATARRRIRDLLRRDPMNAGAQLLRDSVEREPRDLLGPQSYPYVVRAGDTIEILAQRLLGNRLKAYQLGRYNALSAPFTLVPGQTLRIPGEAPRVEPVRRPYPAATPRPTPSPRATQGPRPAAPVAAAPRAATPAANPAAARQMRTAGLAALNGGDVGRAVALLRRAVAADPGNPLAARDLARAERIGRTVQAHR